MVMRDGFFFFMLREGILRGDVGVDKFWGVVMVLDNRKILYLFIFIDIIFMCW